MIPAQPSTLFKAWMGRKVEGEIKRVFGELRVRGLERLRAASRASPLLVVSNHTSYWDPMFCIYLSARLAPFDGYALMLSENLRRFPFLGRLGGFGMDSMNRQDARAALRYAAGLLSRVGRVVWIFPQGKERPITQRPLGFLPGAAVVGQLAPQAQVLPAAFRYEFGVSEKPSMLVSFGEPLDASSKLSEAVSAQEGAVSEEMERIEAYVRQPSRIPGFELVLRSGPSWLSRVALRLLSLFTHYKGGEDANRHPAGVPGR